MRIFVTGGTGFIGSHFLNQAHRAGHDLVAIRRVGSKPVFELNSQPQWLEGDLETVPDEALSGCDALVHFASHGVMDPAGAGWLDCFRWNVHASLSLWLKAAKAGIRRLVICGSCFEYGKSGEKYDFIPPTAELLPTGPYHSSKAAASMAAVGIAVSHQIEVIILRPFHVYGEGEALPRFWPSLRRAALAGEDFPMTAGTQIRDFVHVTQIANAFVGALARDDINAGDPVIENLGTGTPSTLADFAKSEWERFGASGQLLVGQVQMRPNEAMRFVPVLSI